MLDWTERKHKAMSMLNKYRYWIVMEPQSFYIEIAKQQSYSRFANLLTFLYGPNLSTTHDDDLRLQNSIWI